MLTVMLASLATPASAQAVPHDGVLECDDVESVAATATIERQLQTTWEFFLALEDCDTDPLRLLPREAQGSTIEMFVDDAVDQVRAECVAELEALATPPAATCPDECAGGATTVEVEIDVEAAPIPADPLLQEHVPYHTCVPVRYHWQGIPGWPCQLELHCTASCTRTVAAQTTCDAAPKDPSPKK